MVIDRNLTNSTTTHPQRMSSFTNVTVDTKANVYFDGGVVSHTIRFADGSRKTLGLIYPGTYHFGTAAPERMEIIAGTCHVTMDADGAESDFHAGTHFDVAGKSGFTISVADGICEYICSFLEE